MDESVLNCEHGLGVSLRDATGDQCPPTLASALNYAVFPGGARVRPQLCLAVALANGNPEPGLASAAAVAAHGSGSKYCLRSNSLSQCHGHCQRGGRRTDGYLRRAGLGM